MRTKTVEQPVERAPSYLPIIGILIAVLLFVIAAAYYPGGKLDSADQIGYDWTRHYLSTLFAITALNGAVNPARYVAIPAMLILCVSVAGIFYRIARKSPSKPLHSLIEIGGIGSMVYAFLAVTTPLHDLLVSIALLFFLVGAGALLVLLHMVRQRSLLRCGMACLALVVLCAVMYYGNVLVGFMAVTQKLVFVVCTGWLCATYIVPFNWQNGEVLQNGAATPLA